MLLFLAADPPAFLSNLRCEAGVDRGLDFTGFICVSDTTAAQLIQLDSAEPHWAAFSLFCFCIFSFYITLQIASLSYHFSSDPSGH